ncbi:ExbD/TolR family protein [Brumicola nitratireducens]|uniref:Biopolymer transport protein n=1 Tax=Glaciecola nitratireducens (strain JCM 12485 / KCTC 12276 / FR1064) TaxID=1085623 RepID=G4QP31_GLANF|nr:biopolymer transporter ExbD [Glaciecola nitratireducens]AEP31739.1 Biopolymer transport protein [Glaciecola nitratireducens FR1064]
MKKSARAKRMDRNHKRGTTKLSLVSLMDIFTILVFFLMLNASDVQVLQRDDSVELPKSTVKTPAKETLLLMINANNILLQGKPVAKTADLYAQQDYTIQALKEELLYQASRTVRTPVKSTDDNTEDLGDDDPGLSITIMGDKSVPYEILKKIMQTSAEAGYTNIALAVENQLEANSDIAPADAEADVNVDGDGS